MKKATMILVAALIGAPIAAAQPTPIFAVEQEGRTERPGRVVLSDGGCFVDLASSTATARIFIQSDLEASTLSVRTDSPSLKAGETVLLDILIAAEHYRDQPFTVTVDGEGKRLLISPPLTGRMARKLGSADTVELRHAGAPAYSFTVRDSVAPSMRACLAHMEANPRDPFASR